ncbi:MAG: helix-turn-helix domain-containing protein [Proteobacteria bacterium]|nr:helix-turn-helix domain-containing protein [Pseudomonadota bacterium]MBI3498546.1 helix-turn-helix domain-containing protein [Pseudomonadota bacterium]
MPASHHIDRVSLSVEGPPDSAALGRLAESWRRSLKDHHIDPGNVAPAQIVTQHELNGLREPLEYQIEIGRVELDQLYSVMRNAGYVVLLCDANGIAIDHRGDEAKADRFKHWGIWLGGVWSESVEGTNGIGTCIRELRPLTVHTHQHFRARNISLSCSGAPIFAPDGRLCSVLDVSSMNPDVSEGAHALSLPITLNAARAIQERLFRARFSRDRILALSRDNGGSSALLLAVDTDQRIVGADRNARDSLDLNDESLHGGVSLWKFFARDLSLFRGNSGGDLPGRLTSIRDEAGWRTIVTAPIARSGIAKNSGASIFHARPRIGQLADMRDTIVDRQHRGGLSPIVLRRVLEYIDVSLRENVGLAALAKIAGLSIWHFARAFKRAVGMPPHGYLLQRRIERARELLESTNLPIAEIALSVGFSDQSHFARHFRRLTGQTPTLARRRSILQSS